jgi:hypothetical protein
VAPGPPDTPPSNIGHPSPTTAQPCAPATHKHRCGTPGEALVQDCHDAAAGVTGAIKRVLGRAGDKAQAASEATKTATADAASTATTAARDSAHATRRLASETADAAAHEASQAGQAAADAAAGAYDSIKRTGEGVGGRGGRGGRGRPAAPPGGAPAQHSRLGLSG